MSSRGCPGLALLPLVTVSSVGLQRVDRHVTPLADPEVWTLVKGPGRASVPAFENTTYPRARIQSRPDVVCGL